MGPKHRRELGEDTYTWLESLMKVDAGPRPVLVINLGPETFREIRVFGALRTIGISIFETDRIPAHWVSLCNGLDEIWVPGQFNIDTYSAAGVAKDKLWAIPYAMNTELFNPSKLVKSKAPGEPFTFLYIFAFGWRKGFDLMLAAFLNEFKKGEAKLILRAFTEGYQGVTRENLKDVLFGSVKDQVDFNRTDLPEVEIIDVSLSPEELLKLYGRADLYISTDRANGWGVPCMEAMALGLPTATINWSGSTGFMTAENSVLIEPTGKLVPVDERLAKALPELYEGHQWAEVTVEAVREKMRWATQHPEELAKLAKQAADDIQNKFNPDALADRIIEHINSYEPDTATKLLAPLGVTRHVFMRRPVTFVRSAARRVFKLAHVSK
ncbi:MAG TPA: glycosyltransferase family 4 protein [Candidatus Saccharimonadia bacterium]